MVVDFVKSFGYAVFEDSEHESYERENFEYESEFEFW